MESVARWVVRSAIGRTYRVWISQRALTLNPINNHLWACTINLRFYHQNHSQNSLIGICEMLWDGMNVWNARDSQNFPPRHMLLLIFSRERPIVLHIADAMVTHFVAHRRVTKAADWPAPGNWAHAPMPYQQYNNVSLSFKDGTYHILM